MSNALPIPNNNAIPIKEGVHYNAEFSLNKLIDFIYKFKKSKFEEFIEFGRLLNHWKYYIVNSFIRINGKRMSNDPMESTNGRIGRIIED